MAAGDMGLVIRFLLNIAILKCNRNLVLDI